MENVQVNNAKYLKKIRKKLRNNATPAEKELWKHLKNSQLQGCKFRRQHSLGNYFMDFYCPEKRLGIELDGNHHYHLAQMEKERKRIELLNAYGISILRFRNQWVFENMDGVLSEIKERLNCD